MTEILDSGTRREFKTGAVRDLDADKGRCDLIPLGVLAMYYGDYARSPNVGMVYESLNHFTATGETKYLYAVLHWFRVVSRYDNAETMFLELAKHYADGLKKYPANNWKKGIPIHSYIDSAVRHLLKFLRGDCDEAHDRAFVWNIVGAIWTVEHKPEMMDIEVEGDNK